MKHIDNLPKLINMFTPPVDGVNIEHVDAGWGEDNDMTSPGDLNHTIDMMRDKCPDIDVIECTPRIFEKRAELTFPPPVEIVCVNDWRVVDDDEIHGLAHRDVRVRAKNIRA